MAPLIQVSELSLFNEDNEPVFKDISFNVQQGEIANLICSDPNRRTTLLNLLIGELEPDKGQILLVGRNVVRVSRKKALRMRKKDVGFIPQNFRLPNRTITQALNFKLESLGRPFDSQTKIEEALTDLGLKEKSNHLISKLSPGDQIKVATALAIVNRPRLLIFNEPFSTLNNDDEKTELLNLFFGLREKRKLTMLIATSHSLESSERIKQINLNGTSVKITQ